MTEALIRIKYDGGDAEKNSIDAKLFGQSLQGIDRMVSDCIIILFHERLPKRSERAPLILKVDEPESGSYSIPALYQETSELLAVGVPIMSTIGPEIIGHYVSAVLNKFKGKDDAVELAINKMAEMHQASLDQIDRLDERSHIEHLAMQQILRDAIAESGNAALDYVAPVGRSVDTASFLTKQGQEVVADKSDADAIRDSQKLDWQGLGNIVLETDGFKFHTSGLSVVNPDGEGFMMAEVNDPTFEEESNDYTLAAQERAKIEVLARKGYKNGNLSKIQILDFVRKIDTE